MQYTLYNKKLSHFLVHPQVGMWHTNNLEEAKEMLAACKEYVETFNKEYTDDFVIANAETGEEICLESPPLEKV